MTELHRLPAFHPLLFARTLREYAARAPRNHTIVECGSWLGAGTYHLADASGPQPIHVYDNWIARQGEVEKAERLGEFGMRFGESYLPIVQENLRKFGDRIFYRQGDVTEARYDAGPIGLFLDDASKGKIEKTWKIFAPHFAEGCIIILMDYFWDPCQPMRDFIEMQDLEFVERCETYASVGVFKVLA